MYKLRDHPQRYSLANELHARPFPEIPGPCRVSFFAVTLDAGVDGARADLAALLDRFGATHPAPEASHHMAEIGRHRLKWELHSEFATYTLFDESPLGEPFAADPYAVFPEDWLESLRGEVLTACSVRIERVPDAAAVEDRLDDEIRGWFVGESLAAAYVLDRNAVVVGDFRIDERGVVRFAIFGIGGVGPRRMGRVLQRVLEIETYKSMAMLTLPIAHKVFGEVRELDHRLAAITRRMCDPAEAPVATLESLMKVSAELEALSSESSFRFGAGRAYQAIVDQRVKALREERIRERQLFSEFMLRRFDPAMRTCAAAERRLESLSEHAARAAELLATRVGVATSEQNRRLLASMNRRAELQMRLQETVEGLSVVAISYYAVNLLAYLLAPGAKALGLSKMWLTAGLVPPVMLVGWLMVRRIKAHVARLMQKAAEQDGP